MAKRTCPNGHTVKDNKALKCPQCGADLPPVPKRKVWPIVVGILVLIVICGIVGTLSGKKDTETSEPKVSQQATVKPTEEKATEAPKPTSTSRPEDTPKPTNTLRPTDTPSPIKEPTSTPIPTKLPKPVDLKGSGQMATDMITLPAPVCVAKFTHNGSGNFIVTIYQGDEQNLLINHIGRYEGARPLAGAKPLALDIKADGDWTVHIEPIAQGGMPAFSGKGDAVSALFDPPGTGPWEVKHDGTANFIVQLHCAGGSDLVQNEIGAVSGSTMMRFGKGPCMWEVQADGNWSLAPRK